MFDLTGRTALVTGASGGIGGAIARALHGQGATVAISGTRRESLDGLAAALGDRVHVLPCNLSNSDEVEALVPAAEKAMGQVDILVANAGITRDNLFVQLRDEDWDDVIRINLTATFRLARAATKLMMRLSLASVAVWWAIFSIPIFRHVPEPGRKIEKSEEGQNVWKVGFGRLIKAFKNIRQFRDLFLFLLAFFVYANGIGTIIYMAVAFGNDLGFGTLVLIGTLLLVQFVGAPFALLFGSLPKKIGLKNSIYLSLGVYTLISILGYFLSKEIHFVLLGLGVASVQGGSQALSRSLIGKLMPSSRSAEFYGFFSVSEKFNSIIGPALFSAITYLTGNGRLAIFDAGRIPA